MQLSIHYTFTWWFHDILWFWYKMRPKKCHWHPSFLSSFVPSFFCTFLKLKYFLLMLLLPIFLWCLFLFWFSIVYHHPYPLKPCSPMFKGSSERMARWTVPSWSLWVSFASEEGKTAGTTTGGKRTRSTTEPQDHLNNVPFLYPCNTTTELHDHQQQFYQRFWVAEAPLPPSPCDRWSVRQCIQHWPQRDVPALAATWCDHGRWGAPYKNRGVFTTSLQGLYYEVL